QFLAVRRKGQTRSISRQRHSSDFLARGCLANNDALADSTAGEPGASGSKHQRLCALALVDLPDQLGAGHVPQANLPIVGGGCQGGAIRRKSHAAKHEVSLRTLFELAVLARCQIPEANG